MGGESPIWFHSLDRYAARYSLCGDEFNDFLHVIMALDAEWLDYIGELARKKQEESGTPPK